MVRDGRWFWWLVGACALVVAVSFAGFGPFADSDTPRETELLVDHGPRPTSTTTSTSSTTTERPTSTTLPATTTSVTTTSVPDAGPSPEDVAAYLEALCRHVDHHDRTPASDDDHHHGPDDDGGPDDDDNNNNHHPLVDHDDEAEGDDHDHDPANHDDGALTDAGPDELRVS